MHLKPLYIVGTQRDVGKTTLSIGLVHALHTRGLSVAYTKPVGQRSQTVEGQTLHDDERVIARLLGPKDHLQTDMVLPLGAGRVEKEIFSFNPKALLDKAAEAFDGLRRNHDAVIIEAMGHVAMGSVLGVSAADVAARIGARALLVSGGGIGRAIDDIALCATFIRARGADLMGVIVNKVWVEKYDRVRQATAQGLRNLGMTPLGTLPFQEQLASPTMSQVRQRIGGEILSGQQRMNVRVRHTLVAAMRAEHMINYMQVGSLVITPGDRTDNIEAAAATQLPGSSVPRIAGMILTGGFQPDPSVLETICEADLPVLLVSQDTYAAASKVHETVFKITPDDEERIEVAKSLVAQYVDVDAIIQGLGM